MTRLDIAHVTATFPPYFAGTGNVAFHNARSLARLGHAVSVYTAATGRNTQSPEEFEVHRLRPLLRIGNAPLLPGLLRMRRHDLVHLHYPFIFGAEMIHAITRLKGLAYVLTYHNDLLSPGVKGGLFRLYDRAVGARIVRSARRVFVPSIDAAPASRLLGPLIRSNPERVQELPNGVDTAAFTANADPAPVRERLSLGPADEVLLFVGQMDSAHHSKGGVPVLLEAVARLRSRRPAIILVGGGDRVPEYSALAGTLGLGDRTHFVGPVPNEQLSPWFAASDIVVQPSLDQEPFGMVAVEAMACGRAVVTSDLPGARRVVTDAGAGLLARPGDAEHLAATIETLLADPALRGRFAASGLAAVAARYEWDRIAVDLEQAYLAVLSS